MVENPVISVIVPAYNEETLIGRCLTSLTNQNFDLPYEIIVVNNNSTDKTAEIARSFGVVVISEPMQSVVVARQRGLTAASAEIVAGADCDCIYPPHWLREIHQTFKDARVVAAGGPGLAEKNPWWAFLINHFGFKLIGWIYILTGIAVYLPAFNLTFRKKVFLELGGYHTYLDFGGDEWDVISRLKKAGRVVFNPQLYMYFSLRRYRVGFIRWFFVHNLYYYVLNYWLARLFKRSLIRAQPVRNI